MNLTVNRELEMYTMVKTQDGKWEIRFHTTDAEYIYKDLAKSLIAKKINRCTYIRSIKRIPNYDGTQTIVVTHDNGVKAVYTVEN